MKGGRAAASSNGGVAMAPPPTFTQPAHPRAPRTFRLVPVTIGVALALPLAVFASVGSFARYTADDYCWAGVLRSEGFFRAQALWYTGYSPRFAFTFLVNLVELAGPAIVPALPALAIVVCVATLTWSFRQFGAGIGRAVLLAELASLATLQTAPDLPQSLYWQTGMLTYLLPLILATFFIGWLRRVARTRRVTWWSIGLCTLLTFVAGGLSETYLIPQNVALTLALLASLLVVRTAPHPAARVVILHLVAALLGGVLALAVIVVAPSTASRVAGTPADLWLAMSAAIATAAYQVMRLARYFPLTALLCLALPALVGTTPVRVRFNRSWFALVTLGVAITLPFCYFPSFYAQNGNPPARSLIVPGAVLIGYLLYVGYLLGGIVRSLPEPRRLAAAAALGLVPIGIAIVTLPQRADAAQHAALWDAEDQQIRASRDAGQTDVTVPPLPSYLGENFVTTDRADWFNVCVARYYDVRSISASPSS